MKYEDLLLLNCNDVRAMLSLIEYGTNDCGYWYTGTSVGRPRVTTIRSTLLIDHQQSAGGCDKE